MAIVVVTNEAVDWNSSKLVTSLRNILVINRVKTMQICMIWLDIRQYVFLGQKSQTWTDSECGKVDGVGTDKHKNCQMNLTWNPVVWSPSKESSLLSSTAVLLEVDRHTGADHHIEAVHHTERLRLKTTSDMVDTTKTIPAVLRTVGQNLPSRAFVAQLLLPPSLSQCSWWF